jgi:hypothetical protein
MQQSGWAALRIFPSAHTNPVFIIVNGQAIHVKQSAEWCRQAVEQCWKMKKDNIRPAEREAAEKAYEKARKAYETLNAKR